METGVFLLAFAILFTVIVVVSLIPFFIARKRNHTYKWVILVLCLFSPTVFLWLLGLIWAVWPDTTAPNFNK